jgi:DNA-binding response OmpR family regulator
MISILVVEDNTVQADEIRSLLKHSDFQVNVVNSGTAALAKMESSDIGIVLTKLNVPDLNGLQLVEKVRELHPAVPVILMPSSGTEELAVAAVQAGAASYIPQRAMQSLLVRTITEIAQMLKSKRNRVVAMSTIAQSQTTYQFGNDHVVAAAVLAHLEHDLRERNYFDPTEVFRIAMALREAVANAIDHGNLQLDSDVRDDSNTTYRREGEKRALEAPYCDRVVTLTASLTPAQVEYTVQDEGNGFDPATIPDPTIPENLDRSHGRGLMLMQSFLDEVRYNDSGNTITLIKRCD